MWESYRKWEKQSTTLTMKLQKEQEREHKKTMAERANAYNDEKRREGIECQERELRMTTDRCYLTQEKKREGEEGDQVIEKLLDNPPPYAPQVQQPVPAQPVLLPQLQQVAATQQISAGAQVSAPVVTAVQTHTPPHNTTFSTPLSSLLTTPKVNASFPGAVSTPYASQSTSSTPSTTPVIIKTKKKE